MAAKLFSVPFAVGGDRTPPIPDAQQSDGSVSYTMGYGSDYELQLGVDPSAKNIGRAGFNSVFNDITNAILYEQAGTVLPWNANISTAIAGYSLGAIVARTDGKGYWQNLLAANTSNPEVTATNWRPLGVQGSNTTALIAGTTTYTVGATAGAFPLQIFTGAPSTDVAVTLPTWAGYFWCIDNRSTGANALSFKTVAGTLPIVVPNGRQVILTCDGTNIIIAAGAVRSQGTINGPVSGESRNSRVVVTSTTTATFTASELSVKRTLDGATFTASGISVSLNTATTGAGGLDTGPVPAGGYLSLYAIMNTSTGAIAVMACTQAVSNGPIYTGANMPAGYDASCLVGVVPTTSGAVLALVFIIGRKVYIPPVQVLSSTTGSGSSVALSIAAAVPTNAKTVDVNIACSTSAGGFTYTVSGSSAATGQRTLTTSALTGSCSLLDTPLLTAQTIYWSMTASSTITLNSINVLSFTF